MYEIGDIIDCPNEIIGNRLVAEGNAQALVNNLPPPPEYATNETAAPSPSVAVSAPSVAEIAENAPTAKPIKKKVVKKR